VPVALQAVGQGEIVDLDNEDLGLVLAELLQGTPGDPSPPLLDERSSDGSPSPDSASPGAIGAAAAGRMKRVGHVSAGGNPDVDQLDQCSREA